jgi:hypothetical protein
MTGATSAGAGATAAAVSVAGIAFEESESVFFVSLLLHADARTNSPQVIIKNFNFMSFDLIVILFTKYMVRAYKTWCGEGRYRSIS